MASTLSSQTSLTIPGLLCTTTAGLFATLLVYRAFFHALSSIPGPIICRLTSLWTYYHAYVGDECTLIDNLHKTYGPIVRIAPNEVSIADGAALAPIYIERGGFLKAPNYVNFDIEGHSTIFSTLDPVHRSVRSKAVVPVFSMTSIRSRQETIEGCVSKLVDRLQDEAAESRRAGDGNGQPQAVNVLNLTRSLALDAVSSYLFGTSFGGINEKGGKMSANRFVDSLVAVGRFFYLPNWAFLALELASARFWPDHEVNESMQKVDEFASLVRSQQDDPFSYQSRLLKAGISSHETEVQCKDLMFAGTDSTGTNLATMLWHLAKRPDVYKLLRDEIAEADAKDPSYNPQSLRYLDAVVREGLRVAMANPTRLPRIVPPQGFAFDASDGGHYFLPGGTQVGIQIFTLHFNTKVFPDPHAFRPERWLDNPTPEMQRDWIPFGVGSRQCIARNLATVELFLGVRATARHNVLEGAEAVGEKIEMMKWFNSKIKGEKVELFWR
ncbi:hypothetical protein LTR91_021705 [Friedmanniomyces endolithicus]|uniref:Cytochrome P450 n=1 Tax=Friedmanniomyces endolithicus TaxID=329885 RepID=A0AAN6H6C1_9PEZI|nr:hypothetical protein LTR94_002684 [Friedmanniomyces endolithicus]KAK0784977.1 hypothetical protein LTR38_012493 [Friedmanniomyces endolithicus]KAK0794549.1 hypothetical protein LTR59_007734 [Friedmanniomyces endolithicus]KAK0797880.1 hypothetical protein LTR75_009697 [Friedmanniomyces endolithicus]KAK0849045.1 hypothetical protein LTR03_005370 [Friedmanniomyces endolithicus]